MLFRHVIGCTHEVQLPLDCGKIPGITTGHQWASTIRVLALLHGKHCTWGMVNTVSSHFQDRHCMQDPGNATKSNKIVPRTAQCPFKSCVCWQQTGDCQSDQPWQWNCSPRIHSFWWKAMSCNSYNKSIWGKMQAFSILFKILPYAHYLFIGLFI